MQLPSFRRILSTDYPKEFQKLIEILSVSLNNGIEVLYQTLNKNVTLRDNVKTTIKDITITVNASGTPIQGGSFKLNYSDKIDAIIVGTATNQVSTTTYPSTCPFISGSQNGTTYNINHISGLQANQEYVLRVTAFHQ